MLDGVSQAVLVKDILPGPEGSIEPYLVPDHMAGVGDTVYFTANDKANGSIHGRRLWRSDGTAAGTTKVTTVSGKYLDGGGGSLTVVGNAVFQEALGGSQLWRIQAPGSHATLVYANPNGPDGMTRFGDNLIFDIGGTKLYVTDGTPHGTKRIWSIPKQMLNGQGSGGVIGTDGQWHRFGSVSMNNFTQVGHELFFTIDGSRGPMSLWRTDGTARGTLKVSVFSPTSDLEGPAGFVALGDTLYFSVQNRRQGLSIWKSDGTKAGTLRVRTVISRADGWSTANSGWISELTPYQGAVYFAAAPDSSHPGVLWRTDGTPDGTVQITLRTKAGTVAPGPLWAVDADLYLEGSAGGKNGLWKIDPSSGAATLIQSLTGVDDGIMELTHVGSTLFYSTTARGGTGIHYSGRIWRSDGTAAGTKLAAKFVGGSRYGPFNLTAAGNSLFLAADDGKTGMELWKIDAAQEPAGSGSEINTP